MVSRRLKDKKLSLGLGLGLETQSLGLGLGLGSRSLGLGLGLDKKVLTTFKTLLFLGFRLIVGTKNISFETFVFKSSLNLWHLRHFTDS